MCIRDSNRPTKENILARTYVPASFINDHSSEFAEIIQSMDSNTFENRYGKDINSDGTAIKDPAFEETFGTSFFLSFDTSSLIRLFISAIYQQSKKIIEKLPAPNTNEKNLKALLVDSWYDNYLGVTVLVRILDGVMKKGMMVKFLSNNQQYNIDRIGYFSPEINYCNELGPGEIGFINASIKSVADCKVGDTIAELNDQKIKPLPGFKPSLPVVFCGIYPVDTSDYERLKESFEKLALNDSSFTYENETSAALGYGFRCGFLGLLHLEVTTERLRREFDLDLITTAPGAVSYTHLTLPTKA